jgi:glycosyltransferase involved in cell wall biosynthesis
MDSYRILLMISSLGTGGAEHHLINLCRYLAANGHQPAVCVVSSRDDALEPILRAESIPRYPLGLRSLRMLLCPPNLLTARNMIGEFAPDVIHAHLFHAEVTAAVTSVFTRAPLVATRHSAGLEFEGARRSAVRLMRSRFASVIAVSDQAREEAIRLGYKSERVKTIPNGVDTDRFRPFSEEERRERRTAFCERFFPGVPEADLLLVGSVGGLKPVKNFSVLPRIAARVAGGRAPYASRARFVLIGEGGERDALAAAIRETGTGPIFAMPGATDSPETYYPLFDLFVLPSITEGVPMAALEAMASGAACVCTDVGGVSETLGAAGRCAAGRCVPGGDEDALYMAISSLLGDERERDDLARRARRRAVERYGMAAWGARTVAVYESVLLRGDG